MLEDLELVERQGPGGEQADNARNDEEDGETEWDV